MDSNVQSSFIPKQVLTKDPRPRREPLGLFFLLALVVLIVALLFFGGTYSYKIVLQKKIDTLIASLDDARRALDDTRSLMPEIEQLDKRLKRALTLLEGHQTLLPFFQFLEDQTLKSIRYSSFNQTGASLTLHGTAQDYEGIARQSVVFASNQLVKDFIFSDLNADSTGKVSFSLQLDLDPSLLSYALSLSAPMP